MKHSLQLLLLLLFPVFAACGTNCKDPANASSAQCTAVTAVVTCGGSAVDQLVSEQLKPAEDALGSAVLGDGSLDYSKAEPVLEDYAIKFGMCFVGKLFDKIGSLHFAAAPGSAGGAPHPTPKALQDTFQKFSSTHYAGKKFVLVDTTTGHLDAQ